MSFQSFSQTGVITETIRGIVGRVTYHNPDNGWSVLRVFPFNNPHQQVTIMVHQTKVFAGATMEFHGTWTVHPKFGRQFKAIKTVEGIETEIVGGNMKHEINLCTIID